MGIFRVVGGKAPQWGQLKRVEFIEVGCGEVASVAREYPNEVFLVSYGTGQFRFGGGSLVARDSQFVVLPESARKVDISGTIRPVHVVRFAGDWGADLYGCGFFNVGLDVRCQFVGDAVSYPKATSFDSHYHDYDEYWVIMEGSGSVVIGNSTHLVRQGDCVAIAAGHRHDFPLVDSRVRAAYVEISAVGKKRLGHLWEYAHGPATPVQGRG